MLGFSRSQWLDSDIFRTERYLDGEFLEGDCASSLVVEDVESSIHDGKASHSVFGNAVPRADPR